MVQVDLTLMEKFLGKSGSFGLKSSLSLWKPCGLIAESTFAKHPERSERAVDFHELKDEFIPCCARLVTISNFDKFLGKSGSFGRKSCLSTRKPCGLISPVPHLWFHPRWYQAQLRRGIHVCPSGYTRPCPINPPSVSWTNFLGNPDRNRASHSCDTKAAAAAGRRAGR